MPIDRKKIKQVCIPLELQSLEGATLRAISGDERDAYYDAANGLQNSVDGKPNIDVVKAVVKYKAEIVRMFLGDEKGNRMIGESEDAESECRALASIDIEKIISEGEKYNLLKVDSDTKKN